MSEKLYADAEPVTLLHVPPRADPNTFYIGPSLHPVGNFSMDGRSFAPQLDITPLEVAALLRLFLFTCLPGSGQPDYAAYVAEHNLDRHFHPPTSETAR